MRARYPDREGVVDRQGVEIHFEVFGEGEQDLVLIPPAPITHSRIFKALVPHLANNHRVVTFDGRGNGRSGRPTALEANLRAVRVDDIVAVMDAAEVSRAVLITHCHAAWWAVDMVSAHPERVDGLVAMAPELPYMGAVHPHWMEASRHWDEIVDHPTGWALYNRHAIVNDYRRWVEFFFDVQLVEPHSTKQYEDAVAWATETTGEVLAAAEEAQELEPPTREEFEEQCRRLGIPTLVIHGELDVCQHVDRGRRFAELTGGELVVIEGAGHLPLVRDPVKVNRAIDGFVDRMARRRVRSHVWTRGMARRRRILYLSSPIGLGHARRDLAITEELRRLRPEIEIDWLAQHPVTEVLAEEGETVHPASEWLVSESAHIASEASGHELHCFQALRRMDEILVANFMVFQEAVEEGGYDLVIADEAWEIDHFWHENPELKRCSLMWLTDFVGFLPVPDGDRAEQALTSDYNAEMIEHVARYPRIRDRAVFVGNPDDVVPEVFGPGLPKIRDWTEQHFDFSGYVTGFSPPTPAEAAQWRADLGYGDTEKVCLVTVGGSGVGRSLLDKAVAAHSFARDVLPDLRMVVIAGPRISPDHLPRHPGLEVRGYVGSLYRHLAVCDVAIVQGGLTTTMELTAAKRPFLSFPLHRHFEQTHHVPHRLAQYRAGRQMDFSGTDPESLAEALVAELGRPADYRDVETDGAGRAAAMAAELI